MALPFRNLLPADIRTWNPTWTGKHFWQPSADATDVLKVLNNAGTSTVLQVDTTNNRAGIRKAPDVTPWTGGGTHVGLDVGGGAIFGASNIIANVAALIWRQNAYSGGFNVYKRGTATDIDGAVLNLHELGYNAFYGWDGAAYGRGSFFLSQATEDWSPTAHGANFQIWVTPNATVGNAVAMMITNDRRMGFGTIAPDAKTHIIATTEQLRLGYNISNYASFTVSAAGALTIATVDAGAAAAHINFNPDGYVGVKNAAPAYTLDVTGNFRCSTGFGCNGTTPQTAYASGGALAAYATGAYGLDSDAHMSALHALVVAMRAALVANGIMS